MADEASPILPAHIEETVQAIARLQARHDNRATAVDRLMERATATIGRPSFLTWLAFVVIAWAFANLAAKRLGFPAADPPPFPWLQAAISLAALCVTVIILTTQRRADELAGLRSQLTLELAILGEQKTAKVIDLLEEIRRDNPLLADREDAEADAMARPADPEAVLKALTAAPTSELEAEGGPAAA